MKCFSFEHKSDGHTPRVLTPGRAQKLVAKTFLLPVKSGTLLLIIFENTLTETESRTKQSRELQTVYGAVIRQLIMQSSGFLSGCLVTIQNSYTHTTRHQPRTTQTNCNVSHIHGIYFTRTSRKEPIGSMRKRKPPHLKQAYLTSLPPAEPVGTSYW